ncbi:MAG: OB-fold nucleic acid binding domain-containing protein [Patescibacteria group bacterium]|jgi:DNA polymerase-3 subunit alpha
MAALLTSDQGDTDRVAIEIEECRNMGIKIMAPDINESYATFTVVSAGEKNKTIRFGLQAIKNVGEHIITEIIRARKEDGHYQDVFDLLQRITDKDLNKKSLESLIKSGALESFGERGQLLANIERLLSFNKELARSKDNKQSSLFADLPQVEINHLSLNPAPAAEQNEKLVWEKELLGLYVSEHPYNVFRPYLVNYAPPLVSLKNHKGDDRVVVAGIISTIKKIITRKGESMLFVKLEDATNTVELLIFPRLLKENPDLWIAGQAIITDGKISEKDQDVKVLVNRALSLNPLTPQKSVDDFKKLLLSLGPVKTNRYNNYKSKPNETVSVLKKPETMIVPGKSTKNILRLIFLQDLAAADRERLKEIFSLFPGGDEVRLKIIQNGEAQIIKTAFLVDNNQKLRTKLQIEFSTMIKLVE